MRTVCWALLACLLAAGTAQADELGDLRSQFKREREKPYATRIKTAKAIAALGTEKAARFLFAVVEDDEDQSMRLNTIHAVARMPPRIVFDQLLGWVRSGDESLRSTAFHAIVYNRDEELPAKLVTEVLASSDTNRRANGIRYLMRRKDPRFLPAAEQFLADFPTSATSLTSTLIAAKTPGAARLLIRQYDDRRKYERDQVGAMFTSASPEVRAVLVDTLGSTDRALRVRAGTLCMRAAVTEAEAALVAAIQTTDVEVWSTMIAALGTIKAASPAARQAILAALGASHPDIQVAGARAVRGSAFPEAMPPLFDLVEASKDRLVAAEAAVTLEQITGQQYGSRADLWRRWWTTEGQAFDFASVKPAPSGTVPQSLIDLAIERGAAALKRIRAKSPPWLFASHPQGTTALVVLALHAAGLDRKDKAVKAAVSFLVKAPVPTTTYDAGVVAMALEAVGGKKHKRRIRECARHLIATQNDAGLWGYPSGDGDNSNTQYAILGLRAAARVGVKIPKRVWTRARDHFLGARGKDGGWAYPIRNPDYSSASMTASGVCCLMICMERLEPDDKARTVLQAAIDEGYTALGTLMKLDKDSLYTLYGIERAGVLGGRATMADKPWYAPGAKRLVDEQGRDGTWVGSYGSAVDTAFAILFLKRATVPLAPAVVTGK